MATLLNSSRVFIPVGKGGSKGQGLLPSGAGEGDYRPRHLRQNLLGGAGYGPTARTLITGGITITKRAKFFLSYPLKPVLVQNLQGAGGHTAL